MPDHYLDVGKALGLMKSLPLVESQKVENAYLPYHSSLQVLLDSDVVGDKVPCHLCGDLYPKKLMRRHVGGHILQDDLDIVCEFLGFIQGAESPLYKW